MGYPVIGDSHWDDAELTASEAASGFPAVNLQRHGTSYRWESNNVTGVKSLLFEAPDRRAVSLVGIMHHNATRYGAYRLRFADSEAEIETSPIVDTAPFGPALFADAANDLPANGPAQDAAWTTPSFDLECWFYPFHEGEQWVLARDVISAVGTNPMLGVTALGKIQFKDVNGVSVLTGTTNVVANQWIHIAGTYDNATNTAKLIVNGVQEATLGGVTTWTTQAAILVSPFGNALSGKVNEVRFWNFARSAAQILADFNSMLIGTESGLLGVWGSVAPVSGTIPNRKAGGVPLTWGPPLFSYGSQDYRSALWGTDDLYAHTWRDGFFHDPVGISCRVVQLDLLDGSNTEDRIRIGRVVLSEALQWTKHQIEGSDFASMADFSPVERSLLGFESGFTQEPKDDFSKRWTSWERWEAEWLRDIYKRVGTTRDVVALNDPDAETVADMALGLYRFPQTFKIRFDHRMSATSGVWLANLQLRGV